MKFNKRMGLYFFCSSLMVFQVSAATGDLVSLKEKLVVARKKLDAVPRVESPKEPKTLPEQEFYSLFDQTPEALERECKALLSQRKDDKTYRQRVSDFVQVAALVAHLMPELETTEIALRFSRSKVPLHQSAYKTAVGQLDTALKKSFLEQIELEKRLEREGNG
ncbi:MAG: hypothetical protein KGQ59_11765 [Bdellovibrionales bacterium]|nr:hypothetical protein [Bdellovibrionales bacterium]